MNEKPILFRGPLVNALLAGTKTMTRRLVKGPLMCLCNHPLDEHKEAQGFTSLGACGSFYRQTGCPYGAAGDRLWVRETLILAPDNCWRYRADDTPVTLPADDPRRAEMVAWAHHKAGAHCVSIHMPRFASRIALEITEVRVERLQAITGADILAEGVVERAYHHELLGKMPVSALDGCAYVDLKSLWVSAWNGINGKKAPWASNPWVWAITFQRVA